MRLKPSIIAGLLVIPAFLLTNSANATPVTGLANIVGNVSVNATSITFGPTFTATTGAQETGSFAGLAGGTIQSLIGGPVTGNTFVPGFVNFLTGVATPVTFDLT